VMPIKLIFSLLTLTIIRQDCLNPRDLKNFLGYPQSLNFGNTIKPFCVVRVIILRLSLVFVYKAPQLLAVYLSF
jgi:hypothetical protein